jgi:hypothetical protein
MVQQLIGFAYLSALLLGLLAYGDYKEGKVPSFGVLALLLSASLLCFFSGNHGRAFVAFGFVAAGALLSILRHIRQAEWADWLILASLALMLRPIDFAAALFIAVGFLFLSAARAYLFRAVPLRDYSMRFLPTLVLSVALTIFVP